MVHYAHLFCEGCGGELWLAGMALLRYMTVLPRRNAEPPDPAGPLLSSLPLTVIEQANMAIARVLQNEVEKTNAKRGSYIMLSDEFTKGWNCSGQKFAIPVCKKCWNAKCKMLLLLAQSTNTRKNAGPCGQKCLHACATAVQCTCH